MVFVVVTRRVGRADEAARSVQAYALEGLAAPGGSRTRLDALLRCVRRLYARDPHRLRDDYWQPCRPAHQPRYDTHAPTLAVMQQITIFYLQIVVKYICN